MCFTFLFYQVRYDSGDIAIALTPTPQQEFKGCLTTFVLFCYYKVKEVPLIEYCNIVLANFSH